MEPTAGSAAFSPSFRPGFTSGTHRRALTVDLMGLLDSKETDGMGWEVATKGRAPVYVAFDPERLWQIPDGGGAEEVGNNRAFHGVMVVFSDGPLCGDEGLPEVGGDACFGGCVLKFLMLRTDFMRHLSSFSAPLCSSTCEHREEEEEKEEKRERDGFRAVLLFTDVKMEGTDDDRALSVVYVQLAKGWRHAVDRVAVQRRAAQVIDAALSLFPSSLWVIFWVDFTGILDAKDSLLPHEIRDAWSDLAAASASTPSAPRVTVLVEPAAALKLRQDGAKVTGEAAPILAADANLSTVKETLCMSSGRRPFDDSQRGSSASERNCMDPHEPLVSGDVDGNGEKKGGNSSDDGEDELIWKKYKRTKTNAQDANDGSTSNLGHPAHEESDDEEDELLWRKFMCVLKEEAEVSMNNATQGLSCLFLECPGDDLFSSPGDDASIRELFASWSSLGSGHLPRTIVLIAGDDNLLERTLLSWVRVPWSQNALILPVFGVSELVTGQHSQEGVELPPSRSSLPSAAAAASLSMNRDAASASHRFFRILNFAVRYFGIDVHHSACLSVTQPLMQAAWLLDFRVVGDYARVFSWVMQLRAGNSAVQGLLDVERERERLFAELCATNELARKLRESPRRPEILLRVMGSMRVGVVRPVVYDAVALASKSLTWTRVRRSLDTALSLSPEQRSRVYRYMASFFTKNVFCVSVDIVRSCDSDYFLGYHFSAVGYLRYELSSWVRRHVFVELQVDFQPLLEGDPLGAETEPHWSRVFRRLSCTCTPRRHEVLLCTETGEKKCRHLAQLLYWSLRPRPSWNTSFFKKTFADQNHAS
ncbi:hypothetical protein TcCL_NonESM01818 [Trypanosoma cruzi]|uniref:VSG exclusion protein 1 n=1 Tax=Trypanosoma cruzi (strain CL Brener) TaxID=353153 RepID=Q4DAB3_TRYCC|nr:hypothetical protein, conserved [Trypanosoma cruzi]EAN89469.1 hypothetical protein, conserved [Trypanosoma cruzi]RNC48222.1 hypothetical protein TcCL_NonESM01818 [Trypanosoma cruzi]|eukprot:XP_811320.1 hypothetical protein [Trypanosoma cruzi strain CL Brener]